MQRRILTYVRYFAEHLYELLLFTSNPLTKAAYFGVVFDKVPTYQQIIDGTQNPSLVPDINEVFRLGFSSNVSLVRQVARRWNPLCDKVLDLGKKLSVLGVVYSDGEVSYLLQEAEK